MKLTRKHLRDLIIEEVSEKKTMVPNSIKHNYLAVSHDENEQNWVREHGIPLGVIPHGYVVLHLTHILTPSSIVTRDDIVGLSGRAHDRIFRRGRYDPDVDLMKALGITHIASNERSFHDQPGAEFIDNEIHGLWLIPADQYGPAMESTHSSYI